MSSPPGEVEDLIAALQSDLPQHEDERRARARLTAVGVLVAGTANAAHAGAASSVSANGSGGMTGSLATGAGAGSSPATGLTAAFTKFASLGAGTKALVAVAALAAGASYPVVSALAPDASPAPAPPIATHPTLPPRTGAAPKTPPARGAAEMPLGQRTEPRPKPTETVAGSDSASVTEQGPPSRSRAAAAPGGPAGLKAALNRPPDVAAGSAALKSSTLQDETALVERALRAARVGDTASARRWLEEHERRFPDGALAPERRRALAGLSDK